ncbi:MAG: OmpH family outer membrane protein [Sphingobacteriaceae bacterium]|nr:OmpH family outer membrane protein [Sphingobacteriaceae bacterium]
MKKLINVLFVSAGLVLCSNVVNAQQKFAHINSTEILKLMPEVKAAQVVLESFGKTKQADIEKMQNEFNSKYEAAIAKQKTISEANKEVVGKELQQADIELQDLKKRINEAQTKAQQEVVAKETDLFTPIQQKAESAIKAIAKEKGYAYVFDLSVAQGQQAAVIYSDGGDDITALVKTKLGIVATAPAATPLKK